MAAEYLCVACFSMERTLPYSRHDVCWKGCCYCVVGCRCNNTHRKMILGLVSSVSFLMFIGSNIIGIIKKRLIEFQLFVQKIGFFANDNQFVPTQKRHVLYQPSHNILLYLLSHHTYPSLSFSTLFSHCTLPSSCSLSG